MLFDTKWIKNNSYSLYHIKLQSQESRESRITFMNKKNEWKFARRIDRVWLIMMKIWSWLSIFVQNVPLHVKIGISLEKRPSTFVAAELIFVQINTCIILQTTQNNHY